MTSQFKNSILCTLAILVGVNATAPIYADANCGSCSYLPSMSSVKGSATTFAQLAVIAALTAGCMRIWTREGDNKPVGYNLDELFAGENVGKNLYYVWDDALVGQFAKGQYLYFDPKTQIVDISDEVAPKGLGGHVAYYWKGTLAAVGTALLAKIAAEELAKSKNKEEFMTNFSARIIALVAPFKKLGGMPDWFKMGMAAIVGGFTGAWFGSK